MSEEVLLEGFGYPKRDWNDDVADWNKYRFKDYFHWVRATYGKEEVIKGFIHLDGYRAMMDVRQSVKENPIEKQPTQILTSASMVKMAQDILNESLREAVEEHANNQFGL